MAETAPASYATDPTAAFESAEAAARLAPRDPFTHLMLARLDQVSFDPTAVPRALDGVRAGGRARAERLHGLDGGWAARARALGDTEGGVAALRRAAELAPNYTYPRWHLGNALLRAGRTEEAFAELRRAADARPDAAPAGLQPRVAGLRPRPRARRGRGGEDGRVARATGRRPRRARQPRRRAGRLGRARAGGAAASRAGAADVLARALYAKGRYRRALAVLAEGGLRRSWPWGSSTNGGFESDDRAARPRSSSAGT